MEEAGDRFLQALTWEAYNQIFFYWVRVSTAIAWELPTSTYRGVEMLEAIVLVIGVAVH